MSIVTINNTTRCVYVNDYRIVGNKPYVTEDQSTKEFFFDLESLRSAFPDLEISRKGKSK